MRADKEPSVIPYALEKLYRDQAKVWAIDAIPAILAWIPRSARRAEPQPYVFDVAHVSAANQTELTKQIALEWDVAKLAQHDPQVRQRAVRLRTGRTVMREHVVELAAYGLALVAISVFLPGRRVVWMRKGVAPDLLLDQTPGALRGVEVAGRDRGGRGTLRSLRIGSAKVQGKANQLRASADVVEAHLSLWCGSPRVSEMFQVKP